MYQGFNLKLPSDDEVLDRALDDFYAQGEKVHAEHKVRVGSTLDAFVSKDGPLDASKMQADWFPYVRADVFISHSHSDERTAIGLAGWLKSKLNLDAFVDSCVWGHADGLLRLIDNKYCYRRETKTYDYDKRNRSTSHVHMMLSVALLQMMDASECILFLNTPSAVLPADAIESGGNSATPSPWIYAEIAMTRLLRKNTHRGIERIARKRDDLGEVIALYPADVAHLSNLGLPDLGNWRKAFQAARREEPRTHALDVLYRMKSK